ncbi:pancreatic lipase-related protein 2 isoform X1 [Microplitis mediator]|uniref:pancreatic lipase-related protein 2 isoform X1 n=2 Tax=Microplitis mediator TaxID=375433 RepID=UPI00255784CB|nr:pancreatic lipase-related protein 2 isoform X1 [Microplitis mediator]
MLSSLVASMFCRLIVIPRVAESNIYISPLPTGTCAFCCSMDLNRDIQYHLYTRKNPTRPQILTFIRSSLERSNFDPLNPTVFYIHGYSEQATGDSARAILNAYLKRGKYNVILVEWGRLSAMPWYVTAVKNTRRVGWHVAQMVKWLELNNAIMLPKLHVIGFSLGAEVAGFMGKSLGPRKVGRITGLDAAYPLYMDKGAEGHLAPSDATFVDVIHTDGGIFGFPSPLGHADFYPNGGRPLQPGCTAANFIAMGMYRIFRHYLVCSHNRAWRYYVESINNPRGFPSTRCQRWRPNLRSCTWKNDAFMGFATDPRTRGIFYLRTNSRTPFAKNLSDYSPTHYLVSIKLKD